MQEVVTQLIHQKGFIYLDEFLHLATSSSKRSYYRSKISVGEDFITSPEISQMFGEIIGLWCISVWESIGRPRKCNIIELGPGNGSLMRDIMKVIALSPIFYDGLSIILLDVSETLIKAQQNTLSHLNDKVSWISDINEINDSPSIFIANEFFDALPIKQYVMENEILKEIAVTICKKTGKYIFCNIPSEESVDEICSMHTNIPHGGILEYSKISAKYMHHIADYININGGGALIVDYGYNIKPSMRMHDQYISTLQGIRRHKSCDILCDLGLVDISAHVDFAMLQSIVSKYKNFIFSLKNQRDFLHEFGIKLRLRVLQMANPYLTYILERQYQRLTDAKNMGELFKILTFYSPANIPKN